MWERWLQRNPVITANMDRLCICCSCFFHEVFSASVITLQRSVLISQGRAHGEWSFHKKWKCVFVWLVTYLFSPRKTVSPFILWQSSTFSLICSWPANPHAGRACCPGLDRCMNFGPPSNFMVLLSITWALPAKLTGPFEGHPPIHQKCPPKIHPATGSPSLSHSPSKWDSSTGPTHSHLLTDERERERERERTLQWLRVCTICSLCKTK